MVKATFFESPVGCLHRCVFAGLDTNDKPQWLMVDQGEEMKTLHDYMVRNLLKDEDIRMLCLEGEPMESTTMALLFGAVLQGYTLDYPRIQAETLQNLRRRGIEWKQEKLELGVYVYKYYEKENHADACRFCIYCNGIGYVMGMDNFNTMKDLMEAVRCFFDALEKGAGIGLRKKLRIHDVDLLNEMDEEDKKMFDKIV